ncbi:MAG TPA: ATP-binding protein, partial [Cellvibrionaceae bacterium]
LIMWAYANAGREYFYLGIGLFWYAVRIFGKERLIFYLYPDFSVEWQMRAVYFGMFLCVPAYMLFIQSLFPRDMSYRLFRIFWYTGVCASVFTALVGSSWYTQLRDPFELLALAFIAYFLLSLVRIVWLRREWSVVVGFLGGVTALLFINEVLFVKGLIAIQLTPWAYIFVALTSLIFLGQRMNVRLLTEAELGARLQTAVASQTQQLQNQIVELDAARRHAVDMARRRTEFMAILSHEVRTPLSGLLGALRLWGQKDKSVSDDTLQQHALVAGESLLAVVNNTLDVTSMEHRQVLTHTCQQLNHCFASIATIMAISANNKNLEFIFTGPDDEYTATWVLADFQKLRQITINLLSNAIKFTRSGQVMLKVSLFERERFPGDISHIDGDKLLIIKVTDTGIGMPAKLLPRIFDAYVQLGHSGDTNSANGSGLGLAITRQLVELHGGAIEVDSEPGQGSCFTVIVPVEDCVPDVFRHAPLQEAVAGLRILVVEDDEVNRTVVSALLQQDGNKVVATGSPAQALRQLQGFPFDVLLLDIRLPEMSGLTLLGHARAQATTTMRPLYVALTANTSGQDVEKYRQAGFDYVLEKPVDRTQLRFVLSRVGAGEDKDGGFLLRNHLSQALQPDAPIDWEFWLGVVSDLGVERAARLLETAKSSLRETIAAMVSSDVSQAPAGVSDLAHKLKSAARSVGMLKVAFIAGTIEINPALSPSLSEDLQRAIDEALRLLSANLSRRHNE